MDRPFPKAVVSPKAEKSLREGHVWVYDTEIVSLDAPVKNGDITDVLSGKGRWLGSALYSEKSKIRLRLISRNTNDRFDEAFFRRRISYALSYRFQVMGDDAECCRLIFGESDQFPGWTVDRYGDVLVSQILSYGIEIRKEMLFRLLLDEMRARGVFVRAVVERNDSPVRALEGLPEGVSLYRAEGLDPSFDGETTIRENGILYRIRCLDGQKTGYFLDQKYNRRAAASLAKDRRVLDCFTHVGSFALNCAAAGAKEVLAVDISEECVRMAEENVALNGFTGTVRCRCEDVFRLLTELDESGCRDYDYIILDPPAFTKSRQTVDRAAAGYREINRRAMSILPRGGYLATCSCSHFMTDELFRKMLRQASSDAGVSLRQIEGRQQAKDHPVLWNVPETDYLKFYLFQIV
ncbi:MAG: class I SAM-dependent rRNA methyltransferase [Clostridia bacterium]|nr:class I SAM-dependent rRNA methyltransferase [Clostridia bacterium]